MWLFGPGMSDQVIDLAGFARGRLSLRDPGRLNGNRGCPTRQADAYPTACRCDKISL